MHLFGYSPSRADIWRDQVRFIIVESLQLYYTFCFYFTEGSTHCLRPFSFILDLGLASNIENITEFLGLHVFKCNIRPYIYYTKVIIYSDSL